MNDLSVITLVKNRAAHLDRLLAGVDVSKTAPREVIIVDMSDEPLTPRRLNVPISVVRLPTSKLPLAAARNRGAAAASGRYLLFLDVDCIPQSGLIGAMREALVRNDHLICAEVRYLGPAARDLSRDAALFAASATHPHRRFPAQGMRAESNPGLFWSLLFGLRRETFMKLNGFDELYEGYGAEDTDFGFRAAEAGVPLMFMGGTGAFHQYHGVINPPLQHLADIVQNANLFYRRWQLWPMQDWLAAFASLGLIACYDDRIVLLRLPTQAEIESATQPPSIYF